MLKKDSKGQESCTYSLCFIFNLGVCYIFVIKVVNNLYYYFCLFNGFIVHCTLYIIFMTYFVLCDFTVTTLIDNF